jgi:hypothetical protein
MKRRIATHIAAALLITIMAVAACRKKNDPVKVSGVSLNKTTLELAVEGGETLAATVSPADAENQAVAWSSSDAAIATVDQSGMVTAVSAGTATITVTTQDGGKTATCTVTVQAAKIAVIGVTLDKTTATQNVDETLTLVATVTPNDATNQNVSWRSSNDAIATVDNSGTVTGIAAGTATITVTTEDGDKTATCTVTVSEPEPTKEIYALDISEGGNWNYMVAGTDGSSMFIKVDKDTDVPTLLFLKPDKNSDEGYTFLFKENGLPHQMIFGDQVFYFGNFRGNKFDLAVINPENTIEYFLNIETDVDWDDYIGSSVKSKSSSGFRTSLEVFGHAVGLFTCAVSIFAPPVASACVSYVVSTVLHSGIDLFIPSELPSEAAHALIEIVECSRGVGGVPDCISLVERAAYGTAFLAIGITDAIEKRNAINEAMLHIEETEPDPDPEEFTVTFYYARMNIHVFNKGCPDDMTMQVVDSGTGKELATVEMWCPTHDEGTPIVGAPVKMKKGTHRLTLYFNGASEAVSYTKSGTINVTKDMIIRQWCE